jgi:catechol 2,3-dioxygenase-like lactoylglutathione lyase family enzyme
MRYAHTNIVSKDWKALADFYINVFDCKLVPPVRKQSGEWLEQGTGLPGAQLEGAHLLLPGHGEAGPTLEIYQYASIKNREHLPANARGYGHIAFEVDNVDKVMQSLLEHGGSSSGTITTRSIQGVGEITFIYARDPEGNLIELQSWDKVD